MEKDYYSTLGVGKGASQKEIKKAFRKHARDLHPDNNPDDAAAESEFKEDNEAYETQSNAEQRKEFRRHLPDADPGLPGPVLGVRNRSHRA